MYHIDQSGKIEQTERHTVIACTNGTVYTILLKKGDKRRLQSAFKLTGNYHILPYLTFAALIALLIFQNKLKGKIIIDREYLGHESLIAQKIIDYLSLLKYPHIPTLEFGHVGKLSNAHQSAYQVARNKVKPTQITHSQEVINTILGIKKRPG